MLRMDGGPRRERLRTRDEFSLRFASGAGAANRGMVPSGMAPSGGAEYGSGPRGAVGGVRSADRELASGARADQARRLSTSSARFAFEPSRSDRIGRPSAALAIRGHGTATAGSSHAKPSSSLPSNSFVTR